MAEYHNILTQVQVRGPAEMGLDERGIVAKERGVEPRFSSIPVSYTHLTLPTIYSV